MEKNNKLLKKYIELKKLKKEAEKIVYKIEFNKNFIQRNSIDDKFGEFIVSAFMSFFLNIYGFSIINLPRLMLPSEKIPDFIYFFDLDMFFSSTLLFSIVFFIISLKKSKKRSEEVSQEINLEILELKKNLNSIDQCYNISDDIFLYLSNVNSNIEKIKDEFKLNNFQNLKNLNSTNKDDIFYIKELRSLLKYKDDNDMFSKTLKKIEERNNVKKMNEDEVAKLKELLKECQNKELTDDVIKEINNITYKLTNKKRIENI